MLKRSTTSLLIVLVLFEISLATGQSDKFKLRFKTVSVPNSQATSISGINDHGAMVGYYIAQDGTEHGLLLQGESVTNIDDPKGVNGTYCNNLNSQGTIVGYYYDSGNAVHSFEYQGGNFTDVGPAGYPSIAQGINAQGKFVGGYVSNGATHGYLWNGVEYVTLDVPGASQSFAVDINNRGRIVLDWVDSGGNYEGAIYNGKKYRTINVPGAVQSIPNALDNAGAVVFSWEDSSGNFHGALLQGKNFHTFDDPKAQGATYGNGIDDHGVIVGSYFDGGSTWGFKAKY
jgi:uncharacterized membrane protein